MREILPRRLWIGHTLDVRDIRPLLDLGIRAAIDLAINEPPVMFPREIVNCRFPLYDGAGNDPVVLQAAIETTRTFIAGSVPTLVFCSAGMSRSPAIVAAALALIEKCDFNASLLRVAGSGPHDVSPVLWNDVVRATSQIAR